MKNSNENPATKSPQTNALAPDTAVPVTLNPRFMVPRQTGNRPRTPNDFKLVPFADLPLYIPNIRTPYVGFDGAINKAAVEVHKEKGLLLLLLPYLDRAEFDVLKLFFKDTVNPVATYTVSQDDIDNDRLLPMYVTPNRLVDGAANPVFIEVTRAGGGTAETQRLNLIIDTARPAGINPVASTLQNENLHKPILPQHLIDFGVGQGDIVTPVPFTIKYYPVNTSQPATTYRKVRDRIRLSIGGKIVEHRVTEGEAAGTADIDIMVITSVWTAIGSGSHVCEYEVVDEAGNHSDGWSPAQIIDVQLDDGAEPLLPIAFIQEAPDNVLNHDTLNGDAHAFIFINGNGYQPGDIIRVIVNGRTAGGEPLVTTYDSPPLTSATAFYITVAVPNADVKALIGGRFQLRYKRIRSGVPDRNSRSNIIDVIGTELPVGLLPPYFIEAIDKVLNPQELFFNVIFPGYAGQNYFDLVTLILVGTYANGNPFYREYDNIAGDGDVPFFITNGPNGDIAKLEGGTLEIYCLVENEHGLRPSQSTLYNVGQPEASLAEPLVLEAPKPLYQFDPAVSLGNANVRVLPDGDIKDGDTVKLYALGNAPGGTPIVPPFPVTDFWEGRTLPFTLPRANVIANTAMRIYYARERENAPTRFSHEVRMGVGAKLNYPVPLVLEATVTGHNQAMLNPRHVLTPPIVTIRVVSDKFPASADIKVFITGKSGIGMPDIPAKSARPEPGTNYVSFNAPNSFVPAYLGEQCTVYYNVIEVGKTTKSEDLELSVGEFTQDELDLVNIPQAPGDVIIKNEGNDVEINAWPYFARTQEVFIDLESATNHELRAGIKVSANEFTARRTTNLIPASYLQHLSSDDKLKIKARVSMDGSGNKSTAKALKPVTFSFERHPSVIREISLPMGGGRMEISPDSRTLYIMGTAGISVIDTSSFAIIRSLVVSSPKGMTLSADGANLYVTQTANTATAYIHTYNTASFARTTISLPSWSGNIGACTTNATNTKLYVTRKFLKSPAWSTELLIFNLPSGSIRKQFELYSNEILSLTTDRGKSVAYGITYTSNFDKRIDLINDTLLPNTPLLPSQSRNIGFHQQRSLAYFTCLTDIAIYNLTSNTITGLFPGFNECYDIACHPSQEIACVTDYDLNTVTILDTTGQSLQLKHTLTGFHRPSYVLASPDGAYMYVINSSPSTLSVISI
jgi:DNA-binding beta-propeller fold protein YncE